MSATPPTPAPMPAFAPVLRPLELELLLLLSLLLVDDPGEEVVWDDAVGVPGEVFVLVGSYLSISTVFKRNESK